MQYSVRELAYGTDVLVERAWDTRDETYLRTHPT